MDLDSNLKKKRWFTFGNLFEQLDYDFKTEKANNILAGSH